jgi:adenosylcobinamide kinase / adenosylcobinamide-phosphate guanylyltransferase
MYRTGGGQLRHSARFGVPASRFQGLGCYAIQALWIQDFREPLMARTIFITGGARSGKSAFAEQIALGFGAPLGYLATAQSLDGEMGERIRKHQQRRGDIWQTVEEPLQLAQILAGHDKVFQAILIDCLTLWLTNLLLLHEQPEDETEELIMADVRNLETTLSAMSTPVIIVSNEVGMGIVPEHKLGRIFRDIAGQANQILAAAADEAWLVASGIPLRLK